jgi:hypothetical protein
MIASAQEGMSRAPRKIEGMVSLGGSRTVSGNCPSVRGGDPGKSSLDRGVADSDFCTILTGQDIDIIRGYRDLDVIQPPWRTNLPRKSHSSRASSFGVSSINYRSRSKTDMIGSITSVCPTCVVKLCTMDPRIHNSQSFRTFLM